MITIQAVTLENFMSIESLHLTFDSQEITAITGENGSGKSALAYSLALALIEYRKGDSYKDFIQKGHTTSKVFLEALYKGAPITFDITISNEKYSTPLTRIIEYQGNRYVNSECTALLKSMDMEYLEHTMFLFQRDNSIVDLKPGERARMLKKLFHFEFDSQVDTLKSQLENNQAIYNETSIRLDELSKQSFAEDPLEQTLLIEDLKKLQESLESKNKHLETLLTFDLDAYEKTSEEQDNLTISIRKKTRTIGDYKSKVVTLEKDIAGKLATIDELTVTQKKLADSLQVDIDDIDKGIQAILQEKSSLDFKRASFVEKKEEKQQHLHIYKQGVCYVCGSELKDPNKLVELEKEIETLTSNITQAEALVGNLEKEKESLQAVRESHKKALARDRTLRTSISDLNTDISSSQHTIESLQLSIKYEEEALSPLVQTLHEISQKAEELSYLKEKEADRESTLQAINEIQSILTSNSRNEAINEERIRKNQQVAKLKEQQEEAKHDLIKKITEVTSSMETTKAALKIFEVDFPNYVILRACSQIESYMNGFIQKVFPYMSVKLQQNRTGVEFYYTPNVSEEDSWVSVKMASGAQVSILSLAWRISIARIYGITTLLLDEIDESSTEENSRLIYEFIASLTTFDQIFLISHKKEAIRAISAMADNVVCYEVSEGIYTEVNPENIE
jgi:DNA repair exonuclease SbcCD ATPase subunit